jgi:hypothetical protein
LPAVCRTYGFHSSRKTAKCLIYLTFLVAKKKSIYKINDRQ